MSAASRRTALAATASVVVALVVSACGAGAGSLPGTGNGGTVDAGRGTPAGAGPAPSPSPAATAHAEADLTFALTMLPHHLQAEEMAGLVPTRSSDPQLKDLATRIARAQHAEVEQLTALLGAWGAAPDDALSDSEHLAGADGMMTDAQLTALGDLSGEAFRAAWLTGMIAHHRGAVALARAELASGTNPATRALAASILAAQQAEVDEMQALSAR